MYSDQFDADRSKCMDAALAQGVYITALPNIDVASIAPLKALMADHPRQTIGMMGLHPCSVKDDFEAQLSMIEAELDAGIYHAVGEIGINLYWDKTHIEAQKRAFRVQINWAKKRKLPIVIHARDSFDEICEILDAEYEAGLTGVFHCFTGGVAAAKTVLGYDGFLIGLGGVLSFKNSGLDKVVAEVGIDRAVLETDAPYLAPAPFRGKRNETAYTRHIAQKAAEILDITIEEVAETTTMNALKLFQIEEK